MDAGTRALLAERALVVHLAVPWERIRPELVQLLATRPLLQGRSELEIEHLFRRRERLYAVADLRVELGRDGVDAAAREVLARLGS
jgi:shikimate kinase